MKERLRRIAWSMVLAAVALSLLSGVAAADNDPIDPNIRTGDPGIRGDKGIEAIINFAIKMLKFISAFAGIVLVGAFIFNGYRIATSVNPQAKAQAMGNLVYVFIGGLVAFGAYVLASLVKNLADTL